MLISFYLRNGKAQSKQSRNISGRSHRLFASQGASDHDKAAFTHPGVPSKGDRKSIIRRSLLYAEPDDLFYMAAIHFLGAEANPVETQQAKGTVLGFCQGNRMSNEDGALLAEGRKQVYCIYFHSLKEINENQIKALLFEAELIDESFTKKKKAF